MNLELLQENRNKEKMGLDLLVKLSYLTGVFAFIWGLRLLSSPDSARRGNILAGIGMALGIIASLIYPIQGAPNNYIWIIAGFAVGGIIGYFAANRVQMTAMPQMVSIFNGLGGACAVVLAMAELRHYYEGTSTMGIGEVIIALLALIIGAIALYW